MRKYVLPLLVFLGVLISIAGISIYNTLSKRTTRIPEIRKTQQKITKSQQTQDIPRLSVIAKNLDTPWAIAFLPDGNILVTERPGRLQLVGTKTGTTTLIAEIPEAKEIGEGGLLGIAVHPKFETNRFVYIYYTYEGDDESSLNRVVRYKFDGRSLSEPTVLVDKIPGAPNHNGGRIKFGPASPSQGGFDGFLYITTGDAQNPSLAQDTNSLAGKILRITDEGKPASGNPFGNLIYSYGHRNPQGITWDNKGRFWETEHGSRATDELNLIEKGANYGWPVIRGDEKREGMVSPVLQSGSNTWAPSGATHLNDSTFFAGLRGQALFEAVMKGNSLELKEHLKEELGRIREVVAGPDGMLYLSTSNRDGRGIPTKDDDKILRVNPTKL